MTANVNVPISENPGNDPDYYLEVINGRPRLFWVLEKIEHLPLMLGNAPDRVPFSTVVDLSAGSKYMAPTKVAGPLDFTPAPGAVANGYNKVKLTADGVNVPTFSGFTQASTVARQSWINTAGQVHIVYFCGDGTYTVWPL
jgi:hypothetical protein